MALGILFPLLLFAADEQEQVSIKLEAHGGPGSILLTWDLPEHKMIAGIRIFRSSDMLSTYKIIELDGLITNRYLDKNVLAGNLVFYRLEMETQDGRKLTSSKQTPAFAKPKEDHHLEDKAAELQKYYQNVVAERKEISDFHEFKSLLIRDFILNYVPIKINQLHLLQMYFLIEEINFDSFLNILPLEDFNASALLFAGYDPSALHDFFENAFNELEPLIRQQILFTPLEWLDEKTKLMELMDKKLVTGMDVYRNDMAFLETLPPVRITHLVKDANGIKVSLTRFGDQRNTIELRMDEELINVQFENNNTQVIELPTHWKYVDLLINSGVVQFLPVIDEKGLLVVAFDDQYIFADEMSDLRTMCSIPEQDFQLNEIAFNTADQKLAVEIAGHADWPTELGLFLNDSLVWEWNSPTGFEVSFVDSSWTLQTSKDFGWLHLCQLDENDTWEILESRPLSFNESFHESKVPDLGTWTTLSFYSFGESNDITKAQEHKQFIPEIFALYQNYPNPFNASTNITFDLLEEATVSLYVADARGRKLQVFLEEIFLEQGFYSFNWSGEYQSSGVYFITLQAQAGDYLPVVVSRKMIYLK